MRGPAGAPAAGLSRWARPPGTGAPRWSAAADPSGSSDTAKYLTRAISSAPILQLAGTASRPPSGRRCAMASPAWTRRTLARTRCLRGRRQEQKPAIRAACLKLLERGRDPRGTLAE
jgi:hypothetical protein